MSKFCQKCGTELNDNDVFCSNCGNNSASEVNYSINNSNSSTNGLALSGFILSIISIFCCGSFSFISLILSIIGLSNSKNENNSGKGFAIAGIVISSIMILFFIAFYILGFSASLIEELENL